MTGINIRLLKSQDYQIGRVMTVFDREDPCPAIMISRMGEVWTTRAIRGVSTVIASLTRRLRKIAMSEYRLQYVDSSTDCRTITVSIATVDCAIECNLQIRVWSSGARL